MRSRLLFSLTLVVALAPPLLALWCVDVLPTHDGPKNLYAAHVWWHAGEPAYASEFVRQIPITAWGFGAVYGILASLLPWKAAYALTWTLASIGVSAGFVVLARALEPRRSILGLVALASTLSWPLYMGFGNYVGSLGFGLGALGVGLTKARWSWRRALATFALLMGATACHPLGAQMAGLGLLLFRLLEMQKGRVLRELGLLFVMGSPALGVSLVSSDVLSDLHAKGIILSSRVYLSKLERLENFGICFADGPWWRAWPIVALALVGVLAGVYSLARRRLSSAGTSVLLVSTLSAAAAFYAPFHGEAWQYFSPRFVPVAILAGLSLLPIERLGHRGYASIAALSLLFDAASNGWAMRYNVAWRERWADAFAGMGQTNVAPGRTLLPIVATPEIMNEPARDRRLAIAYSSPLLNLGELYGVDRDAVTPYSFSFLPWMHMVKETGRIMGKVPKKDYGYFFAPSTAPAERRAELIRLASFGGGYDDFLFLGDPGDVRVLKDIGYTVDVERGGFFIGHLVGCEADLEVSGSASGQASVLLGWNPADRIVETSTLDLDHARTAHFQRVSCIGAWVKVIVEGVVCAEADPQGWVPEVPGNPHHLRCSLVDAAPSGTGQAPRREVHP